ncbi:ROK family transcriptional regulator [Rhodovulum sp. FJ3]|uniref:ROK family transcriptional regulator n=1 Tax=Rhodovulum sp. FJ3 TaxID=3079053 RepID=UPI00293DEE0D|nr:ROK family transcriptional regulator [Rhodovulum sp. FJ3]MDV4169945.1 ROK family transcriptional regulator [Rhodovulum sp. FJ3]
MTTTEVRKFSGGVNQRGVRDHNERLLISTIQRHGALPGSDLARLSGLSPQTVSVILRSLESEGFIKRGEPKRGRVGKPSIPMALSEDGVYSIGLKIGRRSADILLLDFVGNVRDRVKTTYKYPLPGTIFGFWQHGLETLLAKLTEDQRARICGVGVAAPFEIWKWHDSIGAPADEFAAWKEVDFAERLGELCELPVFVENDATAACRAEHVYGRGKDFSDYAYFFVGAFIGGGVVLNDSVYPGARNNAGAFGSLPMPKTGGGVEQLIDSASIYRLEAAMVAAGHDPAALWQEEPDWSGIDEVLVPWLDETGENLARAALAVCSVIDFEAVVIDGAFPAAIREALVERVRASLGRLDGRGLLLPTAECGSVGADARGIGAASLPIFANFMLNTNAGFQRV